MTGPGAGISGSAEGISGPGAGTTSPEAGIAGSVASSVLSPPTHWSVMTLTQCGGSHFMN